MLAAAAVEQLSLQRGQVENERMSAGSQVLSLGSPEMLRQPLPPPLRVVGRQRWPPWPLNSDLLSAVVVAVAAVVVEVVEVAAAAVAFPTSRPSVI